MLEGTGLIEVKKRFPDRVFDVGIAEEHAIICAGGMAKAGWKPVVSIYSTFLQRSFDQLIHDVALQQLPVTVCIDRAGLVGDDGKTHQGVFDISYTRMIPEHDGRRAARRERAPAHPLHRHHSGQPLRGPLPARAGARRRARPAAEDDADRKGRDPPRGTRPVLVAYGSMVSVATRPPTSSSVAACRSASPTPASPSRSTWRCSPDRRVAPAHPDARGAPRRGRLRRRSARGVPRRGPAHGRAPRARDR